MQTIELHTLMAKSLSANGDVDEAQNDNADDNSVAYLGRSGAGTGTSADSDTVNSKASIIDTDNAANTLAQMPPASDTADNATDNVKTSSKATLLLRFECLKVINKAQDTKYTPIHSYKLYLFYKKQGTFYCSPGNSTPAQQIERIEDDNPQGYTADDIGKCDYPFVSGATYYCYFAGKRLDDDEINRLIVQGEHLLIRITVSDELVRIDQSFFWWICLLQNIEAVHSNTLEVLTKVRKLFYDNGHWNSLINTDVKAFYRYDKDKGGPVSKNTQVPLKVLFAIGRSYFQQGDVYTLKDDGTPQKLTQKTNDIENSGITFFEKERSYLPDKDLGVFIADRHDFVILPSISENNTIEPSKQGKTIQIGHVLTGIEVVHYGMDWFGKKAFDYQKSAATWGGDLGQSVFETINNVPAGFIFESDLAKQQRLTTWKVIWDKTVKQKASFEELFADVHGYQLGEKLKTKIIANKPLSFLLEEYFHYSKQMTAEKQKFKQMAGAEFEQLRTEIEAFAEVWDSNKMANFNKDNDEHQQVVTWAIEHFKNNFDKY